MSGMDQNSKTGRAAWAARPGRESLRKRLGRLAEQIAARDGNRCVYCGATAESSGAPLHLDHLTPRSAGGTDEASNLVLACCRCNCTRQARSLAEWARIAATIGLVFTASSIRGQARRKLPSISRGAK